MDNYPKILIYLQNWSRPISRVLSRTTIHLGRTSPYASSDLPGPNAGRALGSLFGLAPGGVYPAAPVTGNAVRSYRTFSPLPRTVLRQIRGGMFSVALSVGSRRPEVIWHPALWSPDFPPPCSAINLEGSAADFRTAVARPTPVGNLNRPEGMCKLRLRGSAVFFRLLQYTFVKAVLFSTGQLRCNVTRLAWW